LAATIAEHPVVLGAFAKLRKATVNFVMSVFTEQPFSHWVVLHDIWYVNMFRKSFEKIQVLLTPGNNNGYLT
jgi:hypothetical protein